VACAVSDGEDDGSRGVDLRRLLAAYPHHHASRRRSSRHLDLQVPDTQTSYRVILVILRSHAKCSGVVA